MEKEFHDYSLAKSDFLFDAIMLAVSGPYTLFEYMNLS